ncbi:MAG: hypothetical protein Q7S87_04945 [Agitococcus sp.]|nr:hypothetical protein [Agitococcus sp.]
MVSKELKAAQTQMTMMKGLLADMPELKAEVDELLAKIKATMGEYSEEATACVSMFLMIEATEKAESESNG